MDVVDLPSPQITNKENACFTGERPDLCRQHLGFKKGMAIASLNINGLRSHLDEVQLLIRSLGIHILALNETKLDPHYPKELTSLPGYQEERLDRTSSGGGVSMGFLFISGTQLNISCVLMFLSMI